MLKDITAALVTLDGEREFVAQFDPTQRWNGWLAAPFFDAATVVDIVDHLNATNDPEDRLDIEFRDVKGYTAALVVTDHTYAAEEGYRPEVIPADIDGLYSLGAFGWVWTETRCANCVEHPGWAHDDVLRRKVADYCRACLGTGSAVPR